MIRFPRAQNAFARLRHLSNVFLIYMRIDAEIKDDTRRANSLRTFNLGLAPQVYSLLSVKEVIQPQVPLRLPCYDFAPVTTLAFGGLAPCGFRHRLRALAALDPSGPNSVPDPLDLPLSLSTPAELAVLASVFDRASQIVDVPLNEQCHLETVAREMAHGQTPVECLPTAP